MPGQFEEKIMTFEELTKAFESAGFENAEIKYLGNGIYRGPNILMTDKGLEMFKKAFSKLLCEGKEVIDANELFERCLSKVNPETRAEVRRNMDRVINARNTMRFISITEIPHPPVDNLSGESEYVLTYAGKRLLPIVAQYCTPPFGTGRKKSHWRDTHFKPLVIEPLYWAYIDYPDYRREKLEAENTEFDYGHNVNHKNNNDY